MAVGAMVRLDIGTGEEAMVRPVMTAGGGRSNEENEGEKPLACEEEKALAWLSGERCCCRCLGMLDSDPRGVVERCEYVVEVEFHPDDESSSIASSAEEDACDGYIRWRCVYTDDGGSSPL